MRDSRKHEARDVSGSRGGSDTGRNALSPAGASRDMVGVGVRPRLTIVTAVWGKWHLDAHFEVNLPTLLAPGNFPALAAYCDTTYLIYTRGADFARIDTAPETAALRQIMKVEIRLLSEDDLKDPIATHHKAWGLATQQAAAEGSLALLMPPDVAWSENAFSSVVARLKQGKRAIFMTYLRAESTTFIEALLARKPKGGLVNAVPAREMVELCVRSLHPLMAAYLRDSAYFPIHPEMILWAIPGEGFALRVLAREMFIFDPGRYQFNAVALPAQSLPPDEFAFLTDSDDLFAVSLATLGKDVGWHVNAHKADPVEIGGWWLAYDSPANDAMASQRIRWHFAPVTEKAWRAKERGADLFVRRAAGVREGLKAWQAARELGCSMASLGLSLAVHTGPFARAVRGRGAAIILLPSDEAFARSGKDCFDRLLTPEASRTLTRLIRAHHLPDVGDAVEARDPLGALLHGQDCREVATADGARLLRSLPDGSYAIGDARVMQGPLLIGAHAVYVVDKLLAPVNVPPSRR